jgi:mono/diheme cytochrome c family protein
MRFYTLTATALIAAMVFGLSKFTPTIANTAAASQGMSFQGMVFADDAPVWDVLTYFGKVRLHAVDTTVEGASAEKGKEIVTQGFTTHPKTGHKTRRQSKYFTCIACHNSSREFADMADNSAENRLAYAVKNNLPFLQGSTFFGIVNRDKYYNGGYQEKYGSVPDIKAAHKDLRKAIHVCATQCSQGRPLAPWEMESVLAYFWTLQLRLSDLNISAEEREKIEFAVKENTSVARAVNILEDKYIDAVPATFIESMDYRTLDSQLSRDEDRLDSGKKIYELSCLHCHAGKKYSFFALDNSIKTFKFLTKKMQQGHEKSLLKITRHGTYPLSGKRAYMPHYSAEKMSDEQLMNLRIYVEKMAKAK